MTDPKIYVPKCSAKEHVFRDGGSIIKLGLHAETMIAFQSMPTSGHGQPETYESYITGVSEPPFLHGCDSSLEGNALSVFGPGQDR